MSQELGLCVCGAQLLVSPRNYLQKNKDQYRAFLHKQAGKLISSARGASLQKDKLLISVTSSIQ